MPFSLDMSHLRHPQQSPRPALRHGVFPCTPALRRYRAGLLRAHPALNRTWATESARPVRLARADELDPRLGPAPGGGRGRKSCEPGHLRAGSGEAHGQEYVQRGSMLDGAGALLAVPARGDFAVQLFSRGHAERASVAVLSHGSAASHCQGRSPSQIVPEGGGSRVRVGQGAGGREPGGKRRRRQRRRHSELPGC